MKFKENLVVDKTTVYDALNSGLLCFNSKVHCCSDIKSLEHKVTNDDTNIMTFISYVPDLSKFICRDINGNLQEDDFVYVIPEKKLTIKPYTKQELIYEINSGNKKPYVCDTEYSPNDYFVIEKISDDGIYIRGSVQCHYYSDCVNIFKWSDGTVMGIPEAEF